MNRSARAAARSVFIVLAFQYSVFAQEPSAIVDFTKQFVRDERGLWTSPLRIERAQMKWLVPLGIGAAAFLRFDRGITDEVQEAESIRRPSRIVSQAGSFPLLATPVALMALGHLSHNERAAHAGSIGLQAVVHSSLIVQALKMSTNRERPDKHQGTGGFWDGGKSFPSGHAMSTWAFAAAMADQYSDKKWVAISGYGVATAVGLSRIGGLNHFPSDVLIGSSLGWLIGHYVSRHHQH